MSIALASAPEATVRFDVEILRVCASDPCAGGLLARPSFWAELGFAGASLSLAEARRLVSAIRAAGGAALIVPSAYRKPIIPLIAARCIAELQVEVLRLLGRGYFGPLRDGEPHPMWWRFYTECRGDRHTEEPEIVAIGVDVIDGHVATADDERQLASWQEDIPYVANPRLASCRPRSPLTAPGRARLSMVRNEPE